MKNMNWLFVHDKKGTYNYGNNMYYQILMLLLSFYNNSNYTYTQVSIDMIVQLLYKRKVDYAKDRRLIASLKESFQWLHDNNYIKILKQQDNYYEIDMASLHIDDERYWTQYPLEGIQAICSYQHSSRFSTFSLIHFYILLLAAIHTKKKYFYAGIDKMASWWEFGNETIMKYTEILENLQLIYVYREQHESNIYGRYEDKNAVITAGHKRKEGKKI